MQLTTPHNLYPQLTVQPVRTQILLEETTTTTIIKDQTIGEMETIVAMARAVAEVMEDQGAKYVEFWVIQH